MRVSGALLACGVAVLAAGCTGAAKSKAPLARKLASGAEPSRVEAAPAWRSLFDGESLGAWDATPFGGEGDVEVREGRIELGLGTPLSGITWTGPFPTEGYEIELSATKLGGTDFFCALTFPIGDEHATFVVGGWGGALCGLSCIDGEDAADNETKQLIGLETGRTYRVRVRVDARSVVCWLDDDQLVSVLREGHKFSLRPEVAPCAPLGIASFVTRATYEDLRYREL